MSRHDTGARIGFWTTLRRQALTGYCSFKTCIKKIGKTNNDLCRYYGGQRKNRVSPENEKESE